jgi:uncharacterized protein with HEPN domain
MDEPKSVLLYLTDIIDSINLIEDYIQNIEPNFFLSSKEKQHAVIRRLEIIGEAAGKIPNSIRERYPNIPWTKINGIRNVAIHHYFGVSAELIWQVAKVDLKELKPWIEKAIQEINQ